MICYRCNTPVENAYRCPVCNADLMIYKKIKHISNAYYNEGLRQASVRNMTGAIISLKASIRFDKSNIQARNLLGLVYYETGEMVEALSEWVISQNYQPKNNIASRYLEDLHSNRSQLEALNQTIKKYNQALLYCKQDSKDLAIIQLKKVLALNPKLVKGYQLLALLYFQNGKLELAKKTLREAGKIDANNTTTLRYLKAVNQKLRESGKKKQTSNDELISYQSGNDTIIMPKRFRETSVGATFLAVLAGLVLGVSVTSFLIVPGVKSDAKAEATKQLLSANDTISANGLAISDLQNRLDRLQSEYDTMSGDYSQNAKKLEDYLQLIEGYRLASAGDTASAKLIYDELDSAGYDEGQLAIYELLHLYVDDVYKKDIYAAGLKAYQEKNYELAIAQLTKIVTVDRDYDNTQAGRGIAIQMLAWSHYYYAESLTEDEQEAQLNYQKALSYAQYMEKTYQNTDRAKDATNLIKQSNQKIK